MSTTPPLKHDRCYKSPSLKETAYPKLEVINAPTLTTAAAAYYLNRKSQTLRAWACYGGPIRPIRFNGRLAWPVKEIRRILQVEPAVNCSNKNVSAGSQTSKASRDFQYQEGACDD